MAINEESVANESYDTSACPGCLSHRLSSVKWSNLNKICLDIPLNPANK